MTLIRSGYLWIFSLVLAFAFSLGYRVGERHLCHARNQRLVDCSSPEAIERSGFCFSLTTAEKLVRRSEFNQAEIAFRSALTYRPDDARALSGLSDIAVRRRTLAGAAP